MQNDWLKAHFCENYFQLLLSDFVMPMDDENFI